MSIEATQTVGELAAAVPGATREFDKLGIDYCCGGSRTLGEACAEAKITVEPALSRLKEDLAAKVLSVYGKNHPELLQVQNLFSALASELSAHLMKEEQARTERQFRVSGV